MLISNYVNSQAHSITADEIKVNLPSKPDPHLNRNLNIQDIWEFNVLNWSLYIFVHVLIIFYPKFSFHEYFSTRLHMDRTKALIRMPRRRNEYRQRLRPRVNDVQQPAPDKEHAPEEEPVPEEVVQVVNRGRRGNRRRAAPEHQQPDQPVEPINQPPPQKQLKTTAVAGLGNTLINTGPLLKPCANEVDIIVSQQIKEKNWIN